MKTRIRSWISILLLGCMTVGLFGCSQAGSATTETVQLPENSIYLYIIDGNNYELTSQVYDLDTNKSKQKNIIEILDVLFATTLNEQNNLISSAMKLIRSSYDEQAAMVKINVNVANELNDQYIEGLAKAAITKTLCQLEYVDSVQFEIYDSSTMMEDGTTIETYDEISFVDTETEGGYLQKGVITLYFANATGDKLLEYDKAVEITTNVSLEQLIIEALITGPLREGYYPTIPQGTTLKKISIKDGVCYVDLSSEFNNTLDTCMDMVTLYSVVNSLCALPTINKVQFLINGEKQEFYRETIPFDGMFEQQMDMVYEDEAEAS